MTNHTVQFGLFLFQAVLLGFTVYTWADTGSAIAAGAAAFLLICAIYQVQSAHSALMEHIGR